MKDMMKIQLQKSMPRTTKAKRGDKEKMREKVENTNGRNHQFERNI